jgi:hypothetical protein
LNLAVDNTIREIGIEDDVVNREISSGTVERIRIPEEKYNELWDSGLVINFIRPDDVHRPDYVDSNRRKRRASGPVGGDTFPLEVLK